MTTKSKSRKSRSPKPSSSNDIEESIRRCAYELYQQRGRVDGFALDDWLQAEPEILGAQKQRKVKAAKDPSVGKRGGGGGGSWGQRIDLAAGGGGGGGGGLSRKSVVRVTFDYGSPDNQYQNDGQHDCYSAMSWHCS